MNIRNPKHWKDCLSTPSVILSKPQKHKTYICVDTEQVISRLFWSNSLKPNFSLSFRPSFSLPPCQPSSLSSSLSLSLFAFVCVLSCYCPNCRFSSLTAKSILFRGPTPSLNYIYIYIEHLLWARCCIKC